MSDLPCPSHFVWNIFVLSVSKVLQERYTYENPYMYMYTIFMYIFICILHIFLGHVRTTTPGTSTVHYQPATATLVTAPARFWSDPAACLATVVPDRFGSAKTILHNFQTLSAHCNNALGLRPCLFARSGGRMLYFSICKHILRCKRWKPAKKHSISKQMPHPSPIPNPQPPTLQPPARGADRAEMKCICFICWVCFSCQLNVY